MTPRTILVADDDPTVIAILTAAFRGAGYRVITAADAMQTVRTAHKNAPDAVVLDIQMPGGTGLNVLKQLKASNDTSHIPIIAISSLGDPKLPETVRGLGADGFHPKPLDPARLLEGLQRLLDGDPGAVGP